MLRITGRVFDPQLVVFDKDGTLIAFESLWHAWFDLFRAKLAAEVPPDEALDRAYAETLGYDNETGDWDPVGPLTLASTSEVVLLFASLIYRHRSMPWEVALGVVQNAQRAARAALPVETLIEPIGDVRGLLLRLKAQGLVLAIATTDDRDLTLVSLRMLGVEDLFSAIICGDDGFALKPSPDMAEEICRRLGIPPQRAMMVGDTVSDLVMARAAGFGCAVAVTSGASLYEALVPYADAVVPDIHSIEVLST